MAIGWRDRHAPACVTDEFYCDREFSIATDFLKFFVAIEIVQSRVATGPEARAVEARGDRAPWMHDRVRYCAHDAHTPCAQLCMRQT